MAESLDVAGDPTFPKLSEPQIARLVPLGARRRVGEGQVIFDQGAVEPSLFVVLEGRLEVVSPTCDGETHITVHQPGQFTGELTRLMNCDVSLAIAGGTDDLEPAFQHDKKAWLDCALVEDHLAFADPSTGAERHEPGDLRLTQLGERRIAGYIKRFGHNSPGLKNNFIHVTPHPIFPWL